MSEEREHPILVAVAMTVADGLPVDWSSLIAEYPELAEDLETLRVLQGIEAVGREGSAPGGGDPRPT